ncbi:hypothetical protein RRF57_010442 [Xylaria bambusicola]|uniref:Uncharacterized protein n=1 Tax=Xylaria bambusicola TaxID=326684 RepID=A0AAN7V3M9_9PEZI
MTPQPLANGSFAAAKASLNMAVGVGTTVRIKALATHQDRPSGTLDGLSRTPDHICAPTN